MFDYYSNSKAKWIKNIANFQVIVGVIAGIVAGNITREFSWSIALYIWISSIFAAVLLHGFAEIIELLTGIYRKMDTVDEIKNKLNRPVA